MKFAKSVHVVQQEFAIASQNKKRGGLESPAKFLLPKSSYNSLKILQQPSNKIIKLLYNIYIGRR
jgi:hypothetical protein